VRELEQLKANLRHFTVEDEATFDTVGRMKAELAGLRDQLQAQDRAVTDLSHDIKIMESLAAEAQSALGTVQNELTIVTEELAKIYHHICTANNITPSRVMLEHSKGRIILSVVLSSLISETCFTVVRLLVFLFRRSYLR
jgi:chromosome segregation ATPase